EFNNISVATLNTFNMSDDDKQLCFYMLKHLIQRNDGASYHFHILLKLPHIRALAHADVDTGELNVLLRLAKKVNNPIAAKLLLEIPAVAEQAKQDNYYVEEEGQLDLRALAESLESSEQKLHATTEQEDKRATAKYEKSEKK